MSLATLFTALKIIVTAVLSALLSGIWVRNWQYREDYFERRIGDIIPEIDQTANQAVIYWSKIDPNRMADELMEADILGRQIRVAGLRSGFADLLPPQTQQMLLHSENEFFRSVTGGDFQSASRLIEPTRLRDIRYTAARYISSLRSATRVRLDSSWWSKLRR